MLCLIWDSKNTSGMWRLQCIVMEWIWSRIYDKNDDDIKDNQLMFLGNHKMYVGTYNC